MYTSDKGARLHRRKYFFLNMNWWSGMVMRKNTRQVGLGDMAEK